MNSLNTQEPLIAPVQAPRQPVVSWIARRSRVSDLHARVVAELAGYGADQIGPDPWMSLADAAADVVAELDQRRRS